MKNSLKVTWSEYLEYLERIVKYAQKELDAEAVVGLTRGGLIPAVYLSHALKIPMIPFDPHLLHVNGTEREPVHLPISPSILRKILIAEDISDTGKTFEKCTKFFANRGFDYKTISVFLNKTTTTFSPDYYVKDSEKLWVVFPYEQADESK